MSYRYGDYRSAPNFNSADQYSQGATGGFRNFSSFGSLSSQGGGYGSANTQGSGYGSVNTQGSGYGSFNQQQGSGYGPMNSQGAPSRQGLLGKPADMQAYGGGSGVNRGLKRPYPDPAPQMHQKMGRTMDHGMGRNMNNSMNRGNVGSNYGGNMDQRRVAIKDRLGPSRGGRENFKVVVGSGNNRGGAQTGGAGGRTITSAEWGTKTAAKKHPAQALSIFFPKSKYEEITSNCWYKYKNVSYKLTIPSKNNAVFVGTGVSFLLKNAQKIAKHEAAVKCLQFYGVPGCSALVNHISEKEKTSMKELKLEFEGKPPSKKLKKIEGLSKPQNITSYVHKLYGPGINYKFEEITTNPKIVFKCTLTVQEKKFEEVGKSKKDAKDRVTEVCIKIFNEHPPPRTSVFENDVVVRVKTTEQTKKKEGDEKTDEAEKPDEAMKTDEAAGETPDVAASEKPVSDTPDADKPASEESAKPDATKADKPVLTKPESSAKPNKFGNNVSPVTANDHLIHLVYELMEEKTSTLDGKYDPLTNVAGIVLIDGADDNTENCAKGKVISVATGRNVIQPRDLKTDGTVIHDSSADILVIRAFRSYLYDELEKAIDGEESVLEKKDEKYALKPQYKLALAKNQAPYGDFMVYDNSVKQGGHRMHGPNRNKRGNGNGDHSQPGGLQYYVQPKEPETDNYNYNPNNMRVYTNKKITEFNHEKHMIVSPSDKMTVLNIVGIQGALLSQFVEPIYFNRLVYNEFVTETAINRTLVKRIESVKVPAPYSVNKPKFGRSKLEVVRPNPKLIHLGYSGWANCNSDWEAIKTSIGTKQATPQQYPQRKDYSDDVDYYSRKLEVAKELKATLQPSILCKKSLLQKYLQVCIKLDKDIPDTYAECKKQATEYHAVKLSIREALEKAGFGTWPKKTIDTDDFKVDEADKTEVDNVCVDADDQM